MNVIFYFFETFVIRLLKTFLKRIAEGLPNRYNTNTCSWPDKKSFEKISQQHNINFIFLHQSLIGFV